MQDFIHLHAVEELVWDNGKPRVSSSLLISLKERIEKCSTSIEAAALREVYCQKFEEWREVEFGALHHPLSERCILDRSLLPEWYGDFLSEYEREGPKHTFSHFQNNCRLGCVIVSIGKRSRNPSGWYWGKLIRVVSGTFPPTGTIRVFVSAENTPQTNEGQIPTHYAMFGAPTTTGTFWGRAFPAFVPPMVLPLVKFGNSDFIVQNQWDIVFWQGFEVVESNGVAIVPWKSVESWLQERQSMVSRP